MSRFVSGLAPAMEALLNYRAALGYSRKTHELHFLSIDRFFAEKYPDADCLKRPAVTKWLWEQLGDVPGKATAIRMLGRYLSAIGKESYVLPTKAVRGKSAARHEPYIFSDAELQSLFQAVDMAPATKTEPFLNELLPVLFRLIYTCGLRPNEGRGLKCENIHLKTGEILITDTKGKKDRLVVMSDDMRELCRDYDHRRAIFAKDNPFFFPSWSGDTLSNRQLAAHLRDCWIRACPETPSPPRIRVYDLRHRFASAALNRWLDDGQDLFAKLPYLRSYMGHKHLNETLYYVHLLPENLLKSPGIDWDALASVIPGVTICPE